MHRQAAPSSRLVSFSAADRAIVPSLQGDLARLAPERVVDQHLAAQRLPRRRSRSFTASTAIIAPTTPGSGAEHARLRAGGREAGRRALRERCTGSRARRRRIEDRKLPLPLAERARDQRACRRRRRRGSRGSGSRSCPCRRGQVIIGEKLLGDARPSAGGDRGGRSHAGSARASRPAAEKTLGMPISRVAMDHLTLQVGSSRPRRRRSPRSSRPRLPPDIAARASRARLRRSPAPAPRRRRLLPRPADLAQDDVAGIALELGRAEKAGRLRRRRRLARGLAASCRGARSPGQDPRGRAARATTKPPRTSQSPALPPVASRSGWPSGRTRCTPSNADVEQPDHVEPRLLRRAHAACPTPQSAAGKDQDQQHQLPRSSRSRPSPRALVVQRSDHVEARLRRPARRRSARSASPWSIRKAPSPRFITITPSGPR